MNSIVKVFKSKDYNLRFNTKTGLTIRYGKELKDNPLYAPAPELLDIEISSGKCNGDCSYCYKSNSSKQENQYMSFKIFKKIFKKFNLKILTQIAFGITDVNSNPDIWKIFEYIKKRNVIPNYTTNGYGVTKEIAIKTSKLCGAVAISFKNKEITYNAVKMFTDYKINQCNIHFVLSEETYDDSLKVIEDIKNDNRLSKLNAIVFLQYKPKGVNPNIFHPLKDISKFKKIVELCKKYNIKFGMDSCSAPLYLKTYSSNLSPLEEMCVEPCESGLFSGYINVEGIFFPCSFVEGVGEWKEGLNILTCKSFENDIWISEKVVEWKNKLLSSTENCNCLRKNICRVCPVYYNIIPCIV
ncbi:MAG: hypothetical protein PHP92_03990 [Candidatus Nanoarchaeia archaeon]|nr:hypothetical protein [Candidatus Nanoarchaeia archaeon]